MKILISFAYSYTDDKEELEAEWDAFVDDPANRALFTKSRKMSNDEGTGKEQGKRKNNGKENTKPVKKKEVCKYGA